ncbi:unnamed protein product, partial [Ectocarpus sp. 13 AM-2016]
SPRVARRRLFPDKGAPRRVLIEKIRLDEAEELIRRDKMLFKDEHELTSMAVDPHGTKPFPDCRASRSNDASNGTLPEHQTPKYVKCPTPDTNGPGATSIVFEGQRGGRCCPCLWFENLLGRYADELERRPLIWKCVTSALVGALGDVISQGVYWAIRGGRANAVWHDTNALRQSLAVAIDGFCVSAPLLHLAYGALDRWLPAEESEAYALAQVLVDVLVLDPIFGLLFMVTTGLLEGRSFNQEIIRTIEDDYAALVFWLVVIGLALAPLQVYTFNRYPVKWRVLISDGIDVLWTFVACFVIGPLEPRRDSRPGTWGED